MREVFTALWSLLTGLITGTSKFVDAYAACGDVVKESAEQFRDEERIRSAARKAELQQMLLEAKAPLESQ